MIAINRNNREYDNEKNVNRIIFIKWLLLHLVVSCVQWFECKLVKYLSGNKEKKDLFPTLF